MKKNKTKVKKQMNPKTPNYKQKSQYDVEKDTKPKGIRPKEIFEGYPKEKKEKKKSKY
jgi:hypothetical protein